MISTSFSIRKWTVFHVIFIYTISIGIIHAQDLMCCSHATGSCRSVCEKISLVDLAADGKLRNQTVQEVQKFCSSQLNSFWDCLNATFKDIALGESWSGRVCCPLPQSDSCRRACTTATSILDLAQGSCRQSDEIQFFSCLERQKEGDNCCGNVRNSDCKSACFDIFRTQLTPTKIQRQKVKEHCEHLHPKVLECVKEFVKLTPAKNSEKHLPCCDLSNHHKCRETCRKVLSSKTTVQEVFDTLQTGGCGYPLPQELFWQCFLKRSDPEATSSVEVSQIERVGMDSAKWHCCAKATTTQCQSLCTRTFTKFWTSSWDDFHLQCLSQVAEENLRNCIEEVDEPCELGCDGLSFCTNFNNRPTELFRSCTSQSDEAARYDVNLWQEQNKLLLPGLTLPLKNISQCSPNVWKAVACTLQIKPCSRHAHTNQICRNVCLNILSQCVDWSSVPTSHSAETVCGNLSPENPDDSCIDLESFLTPSEQNYRHNSNELVSSPCKGDPCEPHETCLLNKNCIPGPNCPPYRCVSGCKLGEVSEYMVPDGTFVRIPFTNTTNRNKDCLKICKCHQGRIEDVQFLPCVTLVSCIMGGSQQLHGTTFDMECNSCSCYAGEVICTKKQCEKSALSGRNTAYTTLPCNCSPHYVPVCGRNGNTYPSACLAKCAGLSDSDIERMPCEDPCSTTNCLVGQKCVPDPQVCLSLIHKPCKQTLCVNGTTDCRALPKSPVCDINNKQYDNVCFLAHHNAKLAYYGPCATNCRHQGRVCGFNGKTYVSECAAWADFVSVDYPGACKVVGLITDKKGEQCGYVKCPLLRNPNCLGITPPGACCPICGGAIRILYSRQQIDRALYALNIENTRNLNLKSMLRALDRQIQVAQCTLRGFLTVELDVFVSVQSTLENASELQLEACIRESEKIASLINIQSSRIVSELSLSSLTSAQIVHTFTSTASRNFGIDLVFLTVFLIIPKMFAISID